VKSLVSKNIKIITNFQVEFHSVIKRAEPLVTALFIRFRLKGESDFHDLLSVTTIHGYKML